MTKLAESLRDWQSDSFTRTLKNEIAGLKPGTLPLYQGTTQGGIVDDSNITVTVMNVGEEDNSILATVGVFFDEIVGGCSCGDAPTSENAYCEIRVSINKLTAETEFDVISG
jgi:hypothetical protein